MCLHTYVPTVTYPYSYGGGERERESHVPGDITTSMHTQSYSVVVGHLPVHDCINILVYLSVLVIT